MAFDIESAKKQGYSEPEIIDFLEKNHPEFKVKEAISSGYSLNEISSELNKSSEPLQNIQPQSTQSLAEQSVQGLRQVPSPIPLSPLKRIHGIKDIARETVMPSEIIKGLRPFEEAGRETKKRVQGIAGLPDIAMGFLPFTPSEFSSEIGSSILPASMALGKGEKMSRRLANKFLGTPSKLLERDIRKGAETLGERALKKGLSGSREEVFEKSVNKVDELEEQIIDRIKEVSKEESKAKFSTIHKEKVATAFDGLISKQLKDFDKNSIEMIKDAKKLFLKENKDLTVFDWLSKKRELYKKIGDTNYLKDTHSTKIEAEMAVARKIRELTERIIPEIKQLNRDQGDYIEIVNSLGKQLAKKENRMGLRDYASIDELLEAGTLRQAKMIAPKGIGQYAAPIARAQIGAIPRSLTPYED